ncbi:(d)CMP kinase [Ruminiclostridium cellulolyticum]|uniref:Cytidylate kinase n=1 Tax=Ruminiclostridium cellulolyticum (strain ATCC 35319 / DSM 5812 / JCM 6584 / H10) TaxID=394503 RepID=B8I2T7_RUMCH|nr:(d)CMP kinase [Ruminiclostridium cellulolyticum]ACL76080.1 cytidylate kinase [Ruminiclostridium cellulolyticum H10]
MPKSIAIDGPAGAGKSTIAKKVSAELGFIYLDTGAMYRAVALKAIETGINTKSREDLINIIDNINITITHDDNVQKIFLDGRDVSEHIRTAQVSAGAADVAAIKEVRLKMVELQRRIAGEKDVVMDGRDIGSYVLPQANLKVFLTANIDERAKRRYEELVLKGQEVYLEEVREDMMNRDHNDMSRAFAPLKKVPDAVEIDSTSMTIEEVAERILYFYNNYANI